MTIVELAVGIALAFFVVGVAVTIAWKQLRNRRALRQDTALSPEERRFVRLQIVRRLAGSALLLVFAGMLIGWFYLEPQLAELAPPPGEAAPVLADHVKESIRFYFGYWIVALLLLLALLAVAVADLWATARFGLRHQRQLEHERRALFQEEAARIRRRRAEMN